MYRVLQNGVLIATVDELRYMRAQRNGVVINCGEREAQGIVVGDVYYHLPWLPALPGAQEATVESFDGAAEIAALDGALLDMSYQMLTGGGSE